MEKIIIHYTPSIYLEANKIHWRSQPLCWFYRVFFGLCFCFFSLVSFGNFLRAKFDIFTLLFSFFCLVYMLYEWTILPIISNNLYKKLKMFEDAVELSFCQDFIEEKSCVSDSKLHSIYQYKLKNDMLLVYVTPLTFAIVPKKFCTDDEQSNRIIDIVSKFPRG
jgi:hypothetical protein